MAKQHVFVYGVLMFADVAEALAGKRLHMINATLREHARCGVKRGRQLPYPAATERCGTNVSGKLITGADAPTLAVFDRFEAIADGLYLRRTVTVETTFGSRQSAQVYLAGPLLVPYLHGEWDARGFRRRHLRHYIGHTVPAFLRRGRWPTEPV